MHAGGYEEPSGVSLDTCTTLLALLHSTPTVMHLQLATLFTANRAPGPAGGGAPCTRDLAVCCSTGTPYPAGFEDRGPELSRRLGYATATCGRGVPPRLLPIYDAEEDVVRLAAYDARLPPRTASWLRHVVELDDPAFLQQTSTSPDHEGPSYARDLRAAYRWLLRIQAAAAGGGGGGTQLTELAYRWSPVTCSWQPVGGSRVSDGAGALPPRSLAMAGGA